jgi:hypothetical protein
LKSIDFRKIFRKILQEELEWQNNGIAVDYREDDSMDRYLGCGIESFSRLQIITIQYKESIRQR